MRLHVKKNYLFLLQVGSRVRVGVAAAGVGEAEVVSCEAQQTQLKLLQRMDL